MQAMTWFYGSSRGWNDKLSPMCTTVSQNLGEVADIQHPTPALHSSRTVHSTYLPYLAAAYLLALARTRWMPSSMTSPKKEYINKVPACCPPSRQAAIVSLFTADLT